MSPVALVGVLLVAQVQLPKDVDDAVSSYVVRIHNKSARKFGNGVLIKRSLPEAFVLTSAHIVGAGDQISIDIFPAKGDPISIDRVKVAMRSDERQQDLAVLSFFANEKTVPDWMKLPQVNPLPPRKPFAAFSAATTPIEGPKSRRETVLEVVELQKPGAAKPAKFWKVKDLPQQGRSGGPLFDANGRLLGICSGGDNAATYFTHVEEIEAFLRSALVPPDR
jgi:hypothetical protein